MSLSRIQSLRMAAVLEDCSNKLDILGLSLAVKIDKERSPAVEQSVCLAAGVQATFRVGRKAEHQFSAAGGGASGAEEEGSGHKKLLQIQLMEEKKVHERSVEFLRSHKEELQQQLQQWQQRTRQILQEKEQQLNSVCCRRTVNLDRLSEMRRKVREMEQVVMEEREEQKRQRRQQAEAIAATKLQAWWRGEMVRRGLGRLKKADDKKGKKKKQGNKTKEGKKTKKAVKKNRN